MDLAVGELEGVFSGTEDQLVTAQFVILWDLLGMQFFQFSAQTPEGTDTFGFEDTPITNIGDIVLIGNTRAGLPSEAYAFDGNQASPILGKVIVLIPNPVGGDFFRGDIVSLPAA